MQFIIVVVVITISIIYMVWRIYRAVTSRRGACAQCDSCRLRDCKPHDCASCNGKVEHCYKKMPKNLEE